MKLFSCRILVSLASQEQAFAAETVLVLIYKHGSHFVQESCPGWVVGGSMPRVEAILVNTVAAML